MKNKIILAGITYGLCVHLKIYPIIYSLPLYLFIDSEDISAESLKNIISNFFTKNRIKFTLISIIQFLILLVFFYQLYGYEFIYETYLYHLVRKDNRHNFSIYFYLIYLNFEKMSLYQNVMTVLP